MAVASPGPLLLNTEIVGQMQSADPFEGVDLIAAPVAGNQGSAQLSYELRLPPGRNGMAPELALTYDSDAGNGWLGLGWSIHISSIEIDTRFGVPRYDGNDVYLLDGMALTPIGNAVSASGETCRQYRQRIEGSFDRILRCGSDSKNYHWIVTDKTNTTRVYGASPNSRLHDPDPKKADIFRWHLEYEQDAFGNRISYSYELAVDTSEEESQVQLYPSRIEYTSYQSEGSALPDPYGPASYSVEFAFSKERSDAFNSGRSGFLILTSRLLDQVYVRFSENLIRRYVFGYKDGEFSKKLLESVAVFGDEPGSESTSFYSHEFEYYTAPPKADRMTSPITWGQLHDSGALGHIGLGDGLASSTFQTGGGGVSVGVGIGPISVTGGGNAFGGDDTSNTSYVELSGDGLLDFADRSGFISYNARLRPENDHIGQRVSSPALPLGHSISVGGGGEVSVDGGVASATVGGSFTQTDDEELVIDMNGDGFEDLVRSKGGDLQVSLNDGNGQFAATFEPWSAQSEAELSLDKDENVAKYREQSSSIDSVLEWKAPYSGEVLVSAPIQKLASGGDGLVLSLYHAAGSRPQIFESFHIAENDTKKHLVSSFRQVNAGDSLFIVLSGLDNTKSDAVDFTPSVEYSGEDLALIEPSGALVNRFAFAEDMRLTGIGLPWVAHSEGSVTVDAKIQKNELTSDVVRLELLKCRPSRTRNCSDMSQWEIKSQTPLSVRDSEWHTDPIDVVSGELLLARAVSELPVDPGQIQLSPVVTYSFYHERHVLDGQLTRYDVDCNDKESSFANCTLDDSHGQSWPVSRSEVSSLLDMHYATYATTPAQRLESFSLSEGGQALVELSIADTDTESDREWSCPYSLYLQGVGHWYLRSQGSGGHLIAQASLPAQDTLFATVLLEAGCTLPTSEFQWELTIDEVDVPVNVRRKTERYPTESRFHGWTAWDWNAREGNSVHEFTQVFTKRDPHLLSPMRVGVMQNQAYWMGRGGAFIGQRSWQTGNVGELVDKQVQPVEHGGSLRDLRMTQAWNLEGEAKVTVVGIGISGGQTITQVDLVDVDGDGLPDSVSRGGIRRNTGNGFAASNGEDLPFGPVRRTEQFIGRIGTGSGKTITRTDSKGKVKSIISSEFGLGVAYAISPTTVDFADLNGDGLVDRVQQSLGDQDITVSFNLGHRFSAPMKWQSPSWDSFSPQAVEDSRPADEVNDNEPSVDSLVSEVLNKLDLTNVLRLQDTTTFNIGAGGTASGIGGGAGVSYSIARTLVDIVDINGDGLPDHVQKSKNGALSVKLNTGHGFAEAVEWNNLPTWDETSIGLPGDAALEYETSGGLSGSVSGQFCFIVCVGASAFYSRGKSATNMVFADINGDGLPDQVSRQGNDVKVKFNQLDRVDLLRAVKNPGGGSIALTYQQEGNYVDLEKGIDMPDGQFVLNSVTVDDGHTMDESATPPKLQTFTTNFSYTEAADGELISGAKYDRNERAYYGYEKVTATLADDSTVSTQYHNQDYYRQGLAHRIEQRGANRELLTRTDVSYANPPIGDDKTWFFPKTTVYIQSVYEGMYGKDPQDDQGKHSQTENIWDDRGNLVRMTTTPDLDEPEVYLTQEMDYETTDTSTTYLTLLQEAATTDPDGAPLRRTTNAYYPSGALKETSAWLKGGIDPSTQAPYAGADTTNLVTRFEHDKYGNLTKVTEPSGYSVNYVYDSKTSTYITEVLDSLNYTSSSMPNYFYGTQAQISDVNGNILTLTYDNFGRPERIIGSTDTFDDPLAKMDYSLGTSAGQDIVWARLSRKDVTHPEDPLVTVVFADGMGRTLQIKSDLEKDEGTSTTVGMVASGAVKYDELGRVIRTGQPMFDNDTDHADVELVDVAMLHPTKFEYDALNRVIKVTRPDEATTTTDYDIEEFDNVMRLHAKTTDANGKVVDTYTSLDGDILGVKRTNHIAGDEKELITRYTYRIDGPLLQVTDAKGNITTAEYDSIGRLVSLDNPDTGLVTYSYSSDGNLGAYQTATLRAKGQRVTYRYTNQSSRLERKDYPESNDVVYEYGSPTERGFLLGNVAGRAKSETTKALTRRFKYDALGNVSRRETEFAKQPYRSRPYTYGLDFTYDSLGRVLSMQYPDELVSYDYDAGGKITRVYGLGTGENDFAGEISAYLKHRGYNEFGEVVRQVAGNDIETSYVYDPLTRLLSEINSDQPAQQDPTRGATHPIRPFQRLRYTYDKVGNIVEMRNDAPFDPTMKGEVQVGKVAQTFKYDDLYQLISATGVRQERADWRFTYHQAFAYDEIGNIVGKGQAAYGEVTGSSGGLYGREDAGLYGECEPLREALSSYAPEAGWNISTTDTESTFCLSYTYDSGRPHAPSLIEEQRAYFTNPELLEIDYDGNGNQVEWNWPGRQKIRLKVDDANRMNMVEEIGYFRTATIYDGSGDRALYVNMDNNEETAYVGRDLTIRDDGTGRRRMIKHIFVGDTRIATKLNPDWFDRAPITYYHPDHLGSANFVSNDNRELVERNEFYPSGESWRRESDAGYTYLPKNWFTGKEFDENTKLNYHGARYYNPHLSQWTQPDPILAAYMQGSPNGGVFQPGNLGLYGYVGNNPVNYVDPTGLFPFQKGDYVYGVYHRDNTYLHALKEQGGVWVADENVALTEALSKSSYGSADTKHNEWKRKSKLGLYIFTQKGRKVHFVLDMLNIDSVIHKNYGSETEENRSITGAELRWLYRNRDNPQVYKNVQFWYQGKECSPPWLEGAPKYQKAWKHYHPRTKGKQHVTVSDIALNDETNPKSWIPNTRRTQRRAKGSSR